MVNEALAAAKEDSERESLTALQSELKELIHLTQESLDTVSAKEDYSNTQTQNASQNNEKTEIDDEYALFMVCI
jgi:hypothetical protein